MPTSEELYLRWKKDGDEDAFRDLYERYHAGLRLRIRRTLGAGAGSAAVDDVAQETWFRALRTETFAPGRRLRPWLARISDRVAADHLRRLARWQQLSLVDPEALPPMMSEPSGAAVAEQDELIETTLGLLAELPTDQQDAVILRFGQKLSFREIGARLGWSIDVAEDRCKRALRTLRDRLQSHGHRGADASARTRVAPR